VSEENALNEQITDAVAQINASVNGASAGLVAAAACQTIAHALALGVQNAVAQQQQAYILRNAMVSAAAAAILDGKREEAEAILQLAETRLASPDLKSEVESVLQTLRAINEELLKLRPAVA
jgi:hypothetical protein